MSHSGVIAGAELSLVELAAAISGDCRVSVLLPEQGPLALRLADVGVECSVVRVPRWASFTRGSSRERIGRWARMAPATFEMVGALRRARPDWVITNTAASPVGAVAARVLGLRHAWFVHERLSGDDLRFELPPRVIRSTVKGLSRVVLVPSLTLREEVRSDLAGRPVEVVPPSIPVGAQPRRPLRTGPLHAVCVGHLRGAKGQLDAIEAIGILAVEGADVRLTLAGPADADYLDLVRRAIDRAGIDGLVEVIGFQDDPHALMAAADVALSCSRYETFGRTIVEAMKLGVPVIATSISAFRELVEPGVTGQLYRPSDADALADCLRTVSADPAGVAAMAGRARQLALGRFSPAASGGALLGALERFGES